MTRYLPLWSWNRVRHGRAVSTHLLLLGGCTMSVFLSNLDDFIVPSQACINPFVLAKSNPIPSSGRITLETDFTLAPFDIPAVKPDLIKSKLTTSSKKVASVSLNDCLACSGCVTSAETVLIEEQSTEKLVHHLQEDDCTVVVAISPQSRASLASYCVCMSAQESFLRIATLLKSMGVSYVIDTASTGDVTLVEARAEFMHRLERGRSKAWEAPKTTIAISSTKIQNISTAAYSPDAVQTLGLPQLTLHNRTEDKEEYAKYKLPMIISKCPGLVCYVEKSQPQAVPFLSTVKSPQQLLGMLIKSMLSPTHPLHLPNCNIHYADYQHNKPVYIVSIQPCFDKKLEAARQDFKHEQGVVNNDVDYDEVDLVLSTTELWNLLSASAVQVQQQKQCFQSTDSSAVVSAELSLPEFLASDRYCPADVPHGRNDLERLFRGFSEDGAQLTAAVADNAGSGGYVEHIYRYATDRLCSNTPKLDSNGVIQYKLGRNADLAETVGIVYESIDSSSAINFTDTVTASCQQDHESSTASTPAALPASSSSSIFQADDVNTGVQQQQPNLQIKFARAYGFRNIQSVLMKMKRGKCEYDLIELMACPSGCVNGGGQLKTDHREAALQTKERVAMVTSLLHDNILVRDPEFSPLVQYLYASHRFGAPLSEMAMNYLHTRYHAVPKLEQIAPLAAKW